MKTIYKTFAIFLIIFNFSYFHLFSQHWQSLSSGIDNPVQCFYTDTSTDLLYIGGWFNMTGDSLATTAIATWNGLDFSPLGCGFDWNCVSPLSWGEYTGPVTCITKYNVDIYASGGFTKADNKPIKYLAKWNGITWDSVRTGIDGVSYLLVHDSELYVSGSFYDHTINITKWDGTSWSDIPLVTNFGITTIPAMVFYKNELYVGGKWSNGLDIEEIFKWDGTNWQVPGSGIRGNMGGINCLAVYKDELYAGGLFTEADGNPGNYIAKWNGTLWSDVGGGLGGTNGQVFDLEVYNNELYAVGVFISAGGVPAQYIAKWDGTNWCGLGSDFGGANLYSVGFYQDMMYVGGAFWEIDGDSSINYIAKWTGGSYVESCGNATGIEELTISQNEIQLYPNPFINSTTLQTTKPLQNATLSIYDILGKEVKRIENINGTEIIISREGLKSGMYFFMLNDKKGFIGNGKIIVE